MIWSRAILKLAVVSAVVCVAVLLVTLGLGGQVKPAWVLTLIRPTGPTQWALDVVQVERRLNATFRPRMSPSPYISIAALSPHNRFLAWGSDYNALRVLDLTTGAESEIEAGWDLTWSPDGSTLAYVRGSSIYSRSFGSGAAGTQRLLTEGRHPSWSADGSQLVFTGETGAFTEDVFSLDISAINTKALNLSQQSFTNDQRGVLSPDGTQLAYLTRVGGSSTATYQLVVTSAAGEGELRVLTDQLSEVTYLSWSPTGQTLAALVIVSGTMELHLYPVEGGAPRIIPIGARRFVGLPRWSPNEDSIAYIDAQDELMVLAENESRPLQLTFDGDYKILP
jgi:Tol biopolymer transport system component